MWWLSSKATKGQERLLSMNQMIDTWSMAYSLMVIIVGIIQTVFLRRLFNIKPVSGNMKMRTWSSFRSIKHKIHFVTGLSTLFLPFWYNWGPKGGHPACLDLVHCVSVEIKIGLSDAKCLDNQKLIKLIFEIFLSPLQGQQISLHKARN